MNKSLGRDADGKEVYMHDCVQLPSRRTARVLGPGETHGRLSLRDIAGELLDLPAKLCRMVASA